MLTNYDPISGSSWIKAPETLENKQVLVNPHNNDKECGKWSIISSFVKPTDHVDRMSHYNKITPNKLYELMGKLNYLTPNEDIFDVFQYLVTLNQFNKFEKRFKLAINVYGWENDKATVLRVSKLPETCKRINLMLLEEDDKTHYCQIKNFNELIHKQKRNNQ